MRLCVKIGGALLESTAGRGVLARTLSGARRAGHALIVVHGGGKQIGALAQRLGLEERRHAGLRITDRATAEVVTWVLAGEVNKTLVGDLVRAGIPAIGLTGADLGLFSPQRKKAAADLGYVGTLQPADVQARRIVPLLEQGIVPVLATLGPEAGAAPGEPFLNVNADEAAGPIAAALDADELVMLSDVAGVLGPDGGLLPRVTASEIADLVQGGVIRDGMIPKVLAATAAVRAGVPRVRILSGQQDDPLQAALGGAGTEIRP